MNQFASNFVSLCKEKTIKFYVANFLAVISDTCVFMREILKTFPFLNIEKWIYSQMLYL